MIDGIIKMVAEEAFRRNQVHPSWELVGILEEIAAKSFFVTVDDELQRRREKDHENKG